MRFLMLANGHDALEATSAAQAHPDHLQPMRNNMSSHAVITATSASITHRGHTRSPSAELPSLAH